MSKLLKNISSKLRALNEGMVDKSEAGYKGEMAISQCKQIQHHLNELMQVLKTDTDLPEWVASKMTLAADYVQTASDYLLAKSDMKEDVEELHEIGDTPEGKKVLKKYVKGATSSAIQLGVKHGEKKAERDERDRMMNRHMMGFSDKEDVHKKMKTTHDDVHKPREKALRRYQGILRATDRLTKEEVNMTDTSMGGADTVAQSSAGEVYKKASTKKSTAPTTPTGTATHVVQGKTGDAYNATPITQRNLNLEHSIQQVMNTSYQLKAIREQAADLSIITPEQRNDWINVERGQMNVVDYFNKYKITGE
jgi:hypothetical protein